MHGYITVKVVVRALGRWSVRHSTVMIHEHRGGSLLANTKSALKRMRSSEKRRVRNRRVRTEARTYVRQARAQIEAGELDEAKKSVALAVRALDKAAEKGVLHKNNAARRKSRLMEKLNQALGSAQA